MEAADSVDAWRLVDYFKSHHRRVRSFLENTSSTFQPEYAHLVLNWLRRHPDKDQISFRDLTKVYSPSDGYDRAGFEDAIQWLMARHVLRPKKEKEDRDRSKGGQEPSPTWDIHPEYPRVDQATKYDP